MCNSGFSMGNTNIQFVKAWQKNEENVQKIVFGNDLPFAFVKRLNFT